LHGLVDITFRVVEIAKEASAADTSSYTGWQLAPINTGITAVAFLGYTFCLVKEAGPVGTGIDAQAAANTGFFVNHHQSIFALVGGSRGAGGNTGSVAAMLALEGNELLAQVGKNALHASCVNPNARFTRWNLPLGAAGYQAGAAIKATGRINDKPVTFYVGHVYLSEQ
jgi:hypothetical protein